MKTNSDTTQTLYIGLDVHKEKTVIAILDTHREAEPRDYGSVATSQHGLERVIRRIAKAQGAERARLTNDTGRLDVGKARTNHGEPTRAPAQHEEADRRSG